MTEIMYHPENAGSFVINKRGKSVKIRKYHMSEFDIKRLRGRWLEEVKDVKDNIRKKAGEHFFNPYRKGVYYYQIQSMFLLGTNKWHSLSDIVGKMKHYMSNIVIVEKGGLTTAWEKFRGKSGRVDALRCKDYIGRIQENMVFFQKLTKLHPTGYRLRQVYSAVDIKRVSKRGIDNGIYYYRLSTYDGIEKALPIRDYSKFTFIKHKNKYISNRFLGTIITKKDNVKSKGVLV